MLRKVCFLLLFTTSLSVDITYRVKENLLPGTFIGDIARNVTLPSIRRSEVKFSPLQKNEFSDFFNISKKGRLYLAKTIDAEITCKYNTECFEILEIAVLKKKSFVKILEVKVIIEDVNDNRPDFQEKYINLQFYETDGKGTKKSIPNAVDKDVGFLNSQITYRLGNIHKQFKLKTDKRVDGSSKLEIILTEELDREIKDTYFVQIIAKDGGSPPKLGVSNVQIIVTDENDNAPIFAQNTYNISLNNTHQTRKPIVRLQASDIDAGRNGKVSYHFGTKTTPLAKLYFKLNNATGEVFLSNDFSFNRKHKYLLYIDARDGGSPSMSSTAILQINIENQDNSSPSIELNFFSQTNEDTASISEDVDIGSFVAYVKVIDNDIGSNGQVSCQLEHEDFILQPLDDKKYKIVVKNAIDREANSYIDFNISCQDRGTPPKTAVRKISIQVTDINDVKPQFSQESFQFFTYENGEPDFPIGLINATDPDLGAGGQLTYYLMNSTENLLPFRISNYGFITTTQPLDREKQDRYRLAVVVKDNGTPPLKNTANVIVEIMDKNDNVPYFTFPGVDPFHLKVHYHPKRQKAITTLRAYDRDSQLNSFLQYEILDGNDKKLFSLDMYSGVMSFSRPVYKVDAGFYKLNVSVKDSGTPALSTTTLLTLTLTVSNSTSKFLTSRHKLSTKEIPVNVMVIILVAAVIVSITIVVSITVCIVRRNHRREILYCERREQGQKFMNQNGQSEYGCNPMSPQSDSQEVMLTHPGINSAVSQATLLRKELYHDSTWHGSPLQSHRQNICQGTNQMALHNSLAAENFREREDMLTSSDHFSEKSTMSSYDDSGNGCSDGNTILYEELPARMDEIEPELPEYPQQSFNKKSDYDTSSPECNQSLNKPKNPLPTDIIDLKSNRANPTDPTLASKPWNLPKKNSFNCYSKPLPAIPKM
ncbi:protocadherin gamma-B1-like [Octopus sinensis]|uniref:Protocadherin gamma-B1-like n=1 Tax=Octopus sinensis TaxID=2607531 RepID=A0A6P7T284_9MOLL|nr:protocadherin gamma-B1-like [Octopus sinensis]